MKCSFLAILFVFSLLTLDCESQEFAYLPSPSMGEFKMLEDVSRNRFLNQLKEKESLPPSSLEETPEKSTIGELDKFVSNRFFLPIICLLVVLSGSVIFLVIDRKKKASQSSSIIKDIEPAEKKLEKSIYHKTPVFRVGNLQNIGSREEQQDSFCISDIRNKQALLNKGLLAVIADGMGGLEGGAGISQLVTDVFRNDYNEQQSISDVPDFLYKTAQKAEKSVEDYMRRTGFNGGSTLIAVLIQSNRLHFISVGDSHIYHITEGRLLQLNHDHTYGALLLKKASEGKISSEEPYTNPKRHALTAYIGMGTFDTVDMNERPVELQVGDKILLCSDGIYNALDNATLIETLSDKAHIAALKMEKAIHSKAEPKQDNFTGIILEYVG